MYKSTYTYTPCRESVWLLEAVHRSSLATPYDHMCAQQVTPQTCLHFDVRFAESYHQLLSKAIQLESDAAVCG